MSMSSHVQELRKKHQALSELVETEQRSPATDALHLKSLKKKKLEIKQQIERLGN